MTYDLRCKGCGRAFGFAPTNNVESRVYCSVVCMLPGKDLISKEVRDDTVNEIFRIEGVTLEDIANYMGVSRQRAHQIVSRRRTPKTAEASKG